MLKHHDEIDSRLARIVEAAERTAMHTLWIALPVWIGIAIISIWVGIQLWSLLGR